MKHGGAGQRIAANRRRVSIGKLPVYLNDIRGWRPEQGTVWCPGVAEDAKRAADRWEASSLKRQCLLNINGVIDPTEDVDHISASGRLDSLWISVSLPQEIPLSSQVEEYGHNSSSHQGGR